MSLSVIYLLHCIARRFIGTALAVSLSLRHTFRVIVLFASIRPGRPKPLRLKGQLPLQQIFIDIGILTLQRQLHYGSNRHRRLLAHRLQQLTGPFLIAQGNSLCARLDSLPNQNVSAPLLQLKKARHRHALHRDFGKLLQALDITIIPTGDKANGLAAFSCSARASDTMHIVFHLPRQIKVND